jgi:hypothetical protein
MVARRRAYFCADVDPKSYEQWSIDSRLLLDGPQKL